jgi:hypothetical protein
LTSNVGIQYELIAARAVIEYGPLRLIARVVLWHCQWSGNRKRMEELLMNYPNRWLGFSEPTIVEEGDLIE